MNKISKSVIEKLTGVKVNDIGIYHQAFCHKSAIKELGLELSNERVEFLGDAVLNIIAGTFLFNTFPYENEGFLTRLRTKLVSGANLCKWAQDICLGELVVMNEKAIKNEWNMNPRILEDTFESLIGAIYIDNGYSLEAPRIFLDRFFNKLDFDDVRRDTNYKDMLMRHMQSIGMPTPEYTFQEIIDSGEKRFCVKVIINGKLLSEGFERNKKMAEQKGAQNVLKCLQIITV